MKAQKYTLLFYIGCFFLFGIPAIISPNWFATTLGYSLAMNGALMEFVGAYGGLILGIGIYLIYCLRTNVVAGLVGVLIIIATLFLGRVMGFFIEQEINSVQISFLTIELMTIVLVPTVLYAGRRAGL